jgi:hypothetical protein
MAEAVVECSEFQGRSLDTIRGWDEFDANKPGRDPAAERIIDVDVGPRRTPKQYDRIEDVRSDLEDLAGSIPSDEPDRELVEQTAHSNILFLRASAGEEFGFEDYVEGTVGFRPRPVGLNEIDESAQRLDEVLREGGLRYNAGSRGKYRKNFVLSGRAKIKKVVAAGVIAAKLEAAKFFDDVPDLEISPEYVSEDKYGVSALTMDPEGQLHWTVNLLPERHPLDLGRINTIAAHEITGHGFHLKSLERSIQTDRVNPVIGATAMHMPYAFQAEALAQNAESLFPDKSWHNVCRALYNEHVGLVLYDAQWRVNHDEDPKAIVASLKNEEKLPFEPPGYYSKAFITDMRDHPLYRAYLATYHPALRALEPLRAKLMADKEDKQQRQVLNRLYNGAFTPQQVTNMMAESS